MISIAALPKPFIGHIGVIQRNAIASWLALEPRPQVTLFGNEEGTAEVAREFGVEHVPDVTCNAHGTPYLDSVFHHFETRAQFEILCYSNCDIILFPNVLDALTTTHARFDHFLLVGECTNLDVKKPLDTASPTWREELRSFAREKGTRRARTADFFAFSKGTFVDYPPLILGRPFFDNWFLWKVRAQGYALIDATGTIEAIHQNHFYTVVPGETATKHNGDEAYENLRVLGGRDRVYWIYDADWKLSSSGLHRSFLGTLLFWPRWEKAKRSTKRFVARVTKPLRKMVGR